MGWDQEDLNFLLLHIFYVVPTYIVARVGKFFESPMLRSSLPSRAELEFRELCEGGDNWKVVTFPAFTLRWGREQNESTGNNTMYLVYAKVTRQIILTQPPLYLSCPFSDHLQVVRGRLRQQQLPLLHRPSHRRRRRHLQQREGCRLHLHVPDGGNSGEAHAQVRLHKDSTELRHKLLLLENS